MVPRVQEALGSRYVGTYSGVLPHSPVETVEAGVAMAQETRPDIFISGRRRWAPTTPPKPLRRCWPRAEISAITRSSMSHPNKITVPATPSPKLPILSVPTTMGCAEFSRGGGGITDHQQGRKLSIAGDGVTHRTVVIDGQALATTPLRILVSTAIGQLRIAIETVYSTGHNPIGDGMALHAIRLLFENLPRCQDGDIDTLLATKSAACAMASLASFGGLGLNTATCHHVGGLYDVPHGEANAILLPHSMRSRPTIGATPRSRTPIRDLKYGVGLNHLPSGRFPANPEPCRRGPGWPSRYRPQPGTLDGAHRSGRADRDHQDPATPLLFHGRKAHPLGAPPHFASAPALALGSPVQWRPRQIPSAASPLLTAHDRH